jgi:flagellar biosynthesis/type III secretory pathway M-ring protein FliF/YscJ
MFSFPSVHPTSWCGEYEHGEVQSMLQAVREAESDGMLTTEEAEAFLAVRPKAKQVTLSSAEREAIEVAAEAYASDHGERFAEILRLLLKRSE